MNSHRPNSHAWMTKRSDDRANDRLESTTAVQALLYYKPFHGWWPFRFPKGR